MTKVSEKKTKKPKKEPLHDPDCSGRGPCDCPGWRKKNWPASCGGGY